MAWVQSFGAKLAPYLTGACTNATARVGKRSLVLTDVNYIDPMLDGWQYAYYGSSGYQRLLSIKQQLDPGNFFRFRQSIGS